MHTQTDLFIPNRQILPGGSLQHLPLQVTTNHCVTSVRGGQVDGLRSVCLPFAQPCCLLMMPSAADIRRLPEFIFLGGGAQRKRPEKKIHSPSTRVADKRKSFHFPFQHFYRLLSLRLGSCMVGAFMRKVKENGRLQQELLIADLYCETRTYKKVPFHHQLSS